MSKYNKELENLFSGDISEWMMYRLPKYLDENFEKWILNPISKNTVEIFVSGYGEQELWEIQEDLLEESFYVILNLLESYGVCYEGHTNSLLDFATRNVYIYPLSELGDEPLDVDNEVLLFSKGFTRE